MDTPKSMGYKQPFFGGETWGATAGDLPRNSKLTLLILAQLCLVIVKTRSGYRMAIVWSIKGLEPISTALKLNSKSMAKTQSSMNPELLNQLFFHIQSYLLLIGTLKKPAE